MLTALSAGDYCGCVDPGAPPSCGNLMIHSACGCISCEDALTWRGELEWLQKVCAQGDQCLLTLPDLNIAGQINIQYQPPTVNGPPPLFIIWRQDLSHVPDNALITCAYVNYALYPTISPTPAETVSASFHDDYGEGTFPVNGWSWSPKGLRYLNAFMHLPNRVGVGVVQGYADSFEYDPPSDGSFTVANLTVWWVEPVVG